MKPLTDQEMEIEIGAMLRIGVTVSAIVVLLGGVFWLLRAWGLTTDYTQFHATAAPLRTVTGVMRGVTRFDASSVIQLGILLLIATPVARVAFCIWGFARQRDVLYVAISTLVLVILVYSLLSGGR
jgi:uncharacterized membrane protein